jgi:hypothetical protein
MEFKNFTERLAWEHTRENKLKLIKLVQNKWGNALFKRHLKKIVLGVKQRIEKGLQ